MPKVTPKEKSRSSSSRTRRTSALTSARRKPAARGGAELIQAVTAWRRWRGDLRGPRSEVGWLPHASRGGDGVPQNNSRKRQHSGTRRPRPCPAWVSGREIRGSGVARLQVADDE